MIGGRTIQRQIEKSISAKQIEFLYGIPDESEKKALKKIHKEITKVMPDEIDPNTLNEFILNLKKIIKKHKVPCFYYIITNADMELSKIQKDTLAWLNTVRIFSEEIKENIAESIEKKPNKNIISFYNYLQFIEEISKNLSFRVLNSKKITGIEVLILFILSVKIEMFVSKKIKLDKLIDSLDSARALLGE